LRDIILNDFDFSNADIHADEIDHHNAKDPHQQASALSDIILGGQDGLVNVLGVILGVAAATGDPYVIMVAGLAATFAESASMAAVAYTSTLADADYYESEREREYRHIQEVPNLEKEEIRAIYRAKGFAGDLLERIVDTITASPDVWVAVMMSEELQLQPVDRRTALRSAIIVGIAAIVGSLIPLAPFVFAPVSLAIILSIVLSALVLFVVGAIKARMTVGHPGKSGLEMAVIGTISALIGYAVGALLRVPASP
jgi:VIT1/CCC1 family predicted Fe2+/Mn2+ transporter